MNPRGPKTEAEDHMVGCYPHCTFNLNPRASSIDTPLHSFIPAKHVDHMHPNSVISVAASRAVAATDEGDFRRRGYVDAVAAAGLRTGPRTRAHLQGESEAEGHHDGPARPDQLGRRRQGMLRPDAAADREGGAIHRAARQGREDVRRREIPDACRRRSATDAVRDSAVAARAGFAKRSASSARCNRTPAILRFVNSHDAPRLAELGTSCPDHFLRTKIKPLYVAWNPQTEDAAALKAKLDRRAGAISQGLRGVLREVQAAELAGDARSESRP